MKKILHSLLVVAALAGATTLSAEDTPVFYIGYCNETVVTPGKTGTSGVNDPSACIYVPFDKVAVTGINDIVSIKVGLGSNKNITELTAWVRSDKDGENLAQGVITDVAKGWNVVTLDTPYHLADGEGVYVGYTFHQTATTSAISTTGLLPGEPNSCFIKTKVTNDWKDYASARGALYIEAGMNASAIPEYDIKISNLTVTPKVYSDDDLGVKFDVTNLGLTPCAGVNVSATIEGLPESDFQATLAGAAINFNETTSYSFTMPVIGYEEATYTVNLTVSPAEGADATPANNAVSGTFQCITGAYRRNVLVEEFTTEKCGYCPEAAAQLHEAIMSYDEDTQSRINCACLHAGYYTDQFTIPADEAYTWFYAGGGTYAPAFMINRDASWSNCDSGSPVMGRPGVAAFKSMFNQVLAQESAVSFKIKGIYEESSKKLTADVEVLDPDNTLDADKRLVVYLTEDNIPGPGQASGGGDFVHQHVLRAVNETWGVEIPGDNHYQYTFTLDGAWKYDDLALVVYAFNRDASDKTNNAVVNSKTLRSGFFTAPTGVENVLDNSDNSEAADTNAPAEYYNIQGMRVNANALTPGLYIVRQGGKTTKTVIR